MVIRFLNIDKTKQLNIIGLFYSIYSIAFQLSISNIKNKHLIIELLDFTENELIAFSKKYIAFLKKLNIKFLIQNKSSEYCDYQFSTPFVIKNFYFKNNNIIKKIEDSEIIHSQGKDYIKYDNLKADFFICDNPTIFFFLFKGLISYFQAKLNGQKIKNENNIKIWCNPSIFNQYFFPTVPFQNQYINDIKYADLICIWSDQLAFNISKMYDIFETNGIFINKPIKINEDGFLRSVLIYQYSMPIADKKFARSCSYTRSGIAHYDARVSNDLELIIKKYNKLNKEEVKRTNNIIKLIIDNKLSKYNNQWKESPIKKSEKKKILIIDQALNDQSVSLSAASAESFKQMLNDAIEENPNSEIYIKVHPEQLCGKRLGFYTNKINKLNEQTYINETENVHFLADSINPISLLQSIDVVYTVGSQMGLEALMCGKKVITYGIPFYAGWGLTEDRNPDYGEILKERNKYKISLQCLIYNAYIRYSHYVSIFTGKPQEIEDAIKDLIYSINEYKINKIKK